MQVISPYDSEDCKGLLKAAVRDPDPVVFLENELLYGTSFEVEDKVLDHDFVLPIGKAKVTITNFFNILLASLCPLGESLHDVHLSF